MILSIEILVWSCIIKNFKHVKIMFFKIYLQCCFSIITSLYFVSTYNITYYAIQCMKWYGFCQDRYLIFPEKSSFGCLLCFCDMKNLFVYKPHEQFFSYLVFSKLYGGAMLALLLGATKIHHFENDVN